MPEPKADPKQSRKDVQPDPGWVLVALTTAILNTAVGWNLFTKASFEALGAQAMSLIGILMCGSLAFLFSFQRQFEAKKKTKAMNSVRIAAMLSCVASMLLVLVRVQG